MAMKLNRGEAFYVLFTLPLLIVACCGLVTNYRVNLYLLVIVFAWAFALTLREKAFSIFQIFLFTYFIFLLSRIYLDAVGAFDMRVLSMYRSVTMTNEQTNEVLSTLTAYLIGSTYAWIALKGREKENIKKYAQYAEPLSFNQPLKILFCIYFFLFCVKLFYMVRVVMRYGYLVVFNGTISTMRFPVIFTGAAIIAEGLFVILLYYNRDKRSFKVLCGMMLIAGVLKTLTGQRGFILVFLFYILYLWSIHYQPIKLFNFRIFAAVLIIPLLIQITWNYRYKVTQSFSEMVSQNIYFKVLQDQGAPLELTGDIVELNHEFTNKVPFFIGYIADSFKKEPAGQVYEDITDGNYLGDHLTYTLSPGTFFAGNGTGTSIVAEAYELCDGNKVLIAAFAFFITCTVLYVSGKKYKSVYWFVLCYFYLKDYIFSPRSSVLKTLNDFYIVLVMCLFVDLLNRLTVAVRRKKEIARDNTLRGGSQMLIEI